MEQRSTGIGRWIRRLALSWLAAALGAGMAGAQSMLLPTKSENWDGTTRDIAAQRNPNGDPQKRAWIAQGRARMAIQMTTRARMNDEDRVFTKTSESYPFSAPTVRERIVAVEVNEDRLDGVPYLYTLTESALYREEIGTRRTRSGCRSWTSATTPTSSASTRA